MVKSEHIPRATIQRLALYVQVLETFRREGSEVVSSETLAKACNVNPSQIRKDLAYFGEFGVRGVGYFVQDLISSIKQALGVDRVWKAALVGVGNLGKALLRHQDFPRRGFHIVGAFDCDPFKIGEEVSGLEVICSRRLKEKVEELDIEIGLITTPPERAQRAANYLADAGVRGIINFAPARLTLPDDIHIEYVDFFHHLYAVAFNLTLDKAEKE
nr:redox-sensing transcriptional repressor Rex [Fundidesulfovibrio agrisoli]